MNDDINHNTQVTFDDGSQNLIYANRLHNEQLDFWNGWACTAGMTSIYIYESEVYGGECCNDYLGKLGGGWEILSTATICKQPRCSGCTIDLMQLKYKE